MINISLIVPNLDIGGLGRMAIELANRLDRQKFRVSVCCLTAAGESDLSKELKDDIDVVFLDKRRRVDLSLFGKVAKILKANNADMAHTHDSMANFYGTVGAKKAGVKHLINTDHGGIYFESWRKKLISRFLLNSNDCMVAVSKDLMDDLVAMGHKKEKMTVIPNGIDFDSFQHPVNINAVREHLGLWAGDFVICAIGRLEEVKNQKFLLNSARVLLDKIPKLKVVLVGDGSQRVALERYAQEQGLEEKIIFLGYRSDIIDILKVSDCLVNCSLFESFGLTIIEAMAAGVPVVATDVGGVREIVKDKQTGFLVPLNHQTSLVDAVMRVYRKEPQVHEMAEAARVMVQEKYSVEGMLQRYEGLYEECLERK